jgi:hypothetical protein
MNPCHFSWGFLDNAYRNNMHTAEELKTDITAAVDSVLEKQWLQYGTVELKDNGTVLDAQESQNKNSFMKIKASMLH